MAKRLRVALLATIVDYGGIEQVLLNHLRHVTEEVEFVPILFAPDHAGRHVFLDQLDALNVTYETLDVDSSRLKYLNPLRNIRDTVSRVKAGRFDVIHAHGYRADLIGLVVSRICRVPIVATCHGFIANDRQLRLYNTLDIFLLRFFSTVIVVSEHMKQDLVARGVLPERIRVITNAVPQMPVSVAEQVRDVSRAKLGLRDDEFVFGFVGRLSEEKGLKYLLEAVKPWGKSKEGWRVVLVGDGPQRHILEVAAREYDLGERVIFAGFQSDPANWYPAMDAFVLPSLTEGTPMALLEAMAAGVPVIATSVGGVPGIISSGDNGILVPSADPPGLLAAMQSVASNSELRNRFVCRARRLICEDFNVDEWVKKVVDAYRAVIA